MQSEKVHLSPFLPESCKKPSRISTSSSKNKIWTMTKLPTMTTKAIKANLNITTQSNFKSCPLQDKNPKASVSETEYPYRTVIHNSWKNKRCWSTSATKKSWPYCTTLSKPRHLTYRWPPAVGLTKTWNLSHSWWTCQSSPNPPLSMN